VELQLSDLGIPRGHSRKLICIPVIFYEKGGKDFVIDYTTDLGDGGVLIQTETLLPVGAELELIFKLPNSIKLIEVRGKVVWANKYDPDKAPDNLIPGMGVKFLDLDPESKQYIDDFIETVQKSSVLVDYENQ
jgi:uncharacterized protein (TIGR02266 family)